MVNVFSLIIAGGVLLASASQELRHAVSVVNVEVPVRVFRGDRFVGDLGMKDFEVFEDGRPQEIQAVYLLRDRSVRRAEAPPGSAAPSTARHFVLMFQMTEAVPELEKAVGYFFDHVFQRGDSLDAVTIGKAFALREDLTTAALRAKAKTELVARIRKEIILGSAELRTLLRDMSLALGAEGESVDLDAYRSLLQRLESLRAVDERAMIAFADGLKRRPGAKHVFLFYQKEEIPQFSPRKLGELLTVASDNPAALARALQLMDMMTHLKRDLGFDREAVGRAFSDASADVHFLFIAKGRASGFRDVENQKPSEDIVLEERSEDIFAAFREIAAATGGTTVSSANMAALLRNAAEAAEEYYLLYYRPEAFRADGRFHDIEVRLRDGRGERISHRAGYFATESGAAAGPEGPLAGGERRPIEAAVSGKTVEELDVSGKKALAGLLSLAAEYCRRLESAALEYVCREEVSERIYGVLAPLSSLESDIPRRGRDQFHEWIYEYQLIRASGRTEEKRTLVRKDGRENRIENAGLELRRFEHKTVVFGPVGLLAAGAQENHSYRLIENTRSGGEAVAVLDVAPRQEGAAGLFGKAWVREKDGAVLKIEWRPASIANYESVERFASHIDAVPWLSFASEYDIEKNGLRFPSSAGVTETYLRMDTKMLSTLSRTKVRYKDYKFFTVETEVRVK